MEELLNYLETKYSPSEIVWLLNEFDQEKVEDYALAHDLCPRCGGDLMVYRWKEYRGEYFGFPAYEPLSELRCESCNETF
jgi:uncharacterized protein with PIN domain